MQDADQFALPPQLWFGLLCDGVAADPLGRINFQSVFNQIALLDPPDNTNVPPHAYLNGVLALGFSEGLGHFEVTIELQDLDGHTLWERPEGPWVFDIGPGERNAAVLVQQVQYWFREPGRYRFVVRLQPEVEHVIQFEVGRQIGPAAAAQDAPPAAQQ